MENVNQCALSENSLSKNKKSNNLYRTTSDNLADIFNLGLQRWNVVIIDWFKYHFNWKDKFFIDKNTKKSVDIQWKSYKEIIVRYGWNSIEW